MNQKSSLIQPNVLRIGLCGCSTAFQGKLEGQQVKITSLARQPLNIPIHFTLREMVVPERINIRSVRARRCHFFLDHHYRNRRHWVNLSMIHMFLTADSGWQVHIGYWVSSRKYWYDHMFYRIWESWQLPTTAEILGEMSRMLQLRTEKQFNRWLLRMTPEGWQPPRLPRTQCHLGT